MRLGIMQPYFFPYPGYFQLISYCDTFIFHDDVQFIKGGWINRNRIYGDGQPKWFTFPMIAGSAFTNICERHYVTDPKARLKLSNQLENSYQNETNYRDVISLFREIMKYPNNNVAKFNINLLKKVSEYIGLKTKFLTSSKLEFNKNLKGQDRVLQICKLTGAKHYINPVGGEKLYQKKRFTEQNIKLQFLKPAYLQYDQRNKNFVPKLSILDFLMFNSEISAKEVLEKNCSIA